MVSVPRLFKFFKPRSPSLNQGFTLIELLVAMVISSIVLVSLLGFMNTILTNSRREEAKAASERDVQEAMDLISDDLNQAIYIYDDVSLYGDSTIPLTGIAPSTSGNQLPVLPSMTAAQQTPVLVLWRRSFLSRSACVALSGSPASQVVQPTYTPTTNNPCPDVGSTKRVRVGCLAKLSTATAPIDDATECSNQDYMPYSLVVYYLTRRGTSGLENTLSNTLQLRRLELRDGIRSPTTVNGTACPTTLSSGIDGCRLETYSGSTSTVPINYILLPNQGFQRFDVSTATSVNAGMAEWKRYTAESYPATLNADILIDYVDQSNSLAAICATGTRRVPDYTKTLAPAALANTGFYACVDSVNTLARVYLRGNGLARMSSRSRTAPLYSQATSSFFPVARSTIRGRGFLNITPTN